MIFLTAKIAKKVRKGRREDPESSGRNSLVRGGSVGHVQQSSSLRDQICNFEGLYQKGQIVLLQKIVDLGLNATGKSKQKMFLQPRAFVSNPASDILDSPAAGKLPIDNYRIKRLRKQMCAHVFGIH